MDFDCLHDTIIDDVCKDCGIVFEEVVISKTSKFTSKTNTELKEKLISTLNLDNDIQKYISILTTEHQILNGKNIRNDSKNTFLLYYRAALRKGEAFNPLIYSKQLGITKKDINWMLKELTNTTLNGKNVYDRDSTPLVVVLPVSIFITKEMCKINNLEEEDYNKIINICDEISIKKDYINSLKPHYIARTILRCYMENKKMNCKGFSQRNGISDIAIKKCRLEVQDYFGSGIKIEPISTKLNIISQKDYISSTLTVTASLNTCVNLFLLVKFLPIFNIFDSEDKRVKNEKGDKIQFYDKDNSIVSICYKNTIRGVRKTAMNNMLSLDYQIDKKNVHVKISKNEICCVGAKTNEIARQIFLTLIEEMNELQDTIKYIRENKEEAEKIKNNLIKKISVNKERCKIKSIPKGDKRIIMCFLNYIEDYNTADEYIKVISDIITTENIFEGKLDTINLDASNSVYHSSLFEKSVKDAKLPLHKLATYFNDAGINSIFHNWCSDGVNICFMVKDKDKNKQKKNYFHRFTIHEKGTIKQTSACLDRAECYKYYRKVTDVLKDFIDENNN